MMPQTTAPGDDHGHYSVAVGSRSGSVIACADTVCFVGSSAQALCDASVNGCTDGEGTPCMVAVLLISVVV